MWRECLGEWGGGEDDFAQGVEKKILSYYNNYISLQSLMRICNNVSIGMDVFVTQYDVGVCAGRMVLWGWCIWWHFAAAGTKKVDNPKTKTTI